MSRYIVGLDFGTHQSKACIEDSANPMQITYEFLEFPNTPKGKEKILFPSVVQINQDGKVSYGFVNPSEAMAVAKEGSNPPVKETVQEPSYQQLPSEPTYESLPPQPESKHKGYLAILAKLLPESEEMKKWRQICASIERANENRRMAWMNNTCEINRQNERLKEAWLKDVEKSDREFDAAMEVWREDQNKSIQMRFRYFKQATFFYRDIWTNDFITPEEASIWYLTYIRFLLYQKLGTDYVVRLGVPCSYSDIEPFKQHAYNLWMSAGKLVDHYKNLDSYLNADYKELQRIGKYEKFVIDESQPFDVRTEAQASLYATVSNKRIDTRINLLFDIGGGTTDIAVFHITSDNQLKILEKISVPMGLNYIFEAYQHAHPNQSLEHIQADFANHVNDNQNGGKYGEFVDMYLAQIGQAAKNLARVIMTSLLRKGYIGRSAVISAVENNPSVFSGGGSLYPCMRKITTLMRGLTGQKDDFVPVFRDIRVVDRNLLNIRNVQNSQISNTTYPILAVSYGLSLSDNWCEVESQNILNTFKNSLNDIPVPTTIIPERNDEAIK